MKEIGILSFHCADNYGAVLQNFALQRAVKALGFAVETIDYRCQKISRSYGIQRPLECGYGTLKKVKTRIADWINYRQAKARKRRFEEFRNSHLILSDTVYDSDNICDAQYDVFITGSDQVWNKNIIGTEDIDVYSLAFTDAKKASYGASCGELDCLIDAWDAIWRLDKVTVREKDLCDVLCQRNIDAEIVCDPVFLLNKEQWQQLICDISARRHKYVFLYCVQDLKETLPVARNIAKQNRLKLYLPERCNKSTIMLKNSRRVYGDGPIEFLAEILNAEMVVTSSFHGTAFSILLEKDFVVVLPENKSSRIKNLLQFVGLEERIVSDWEDYQRKCRNWEPIDYDKIRPRIESWRKQSMDQLKEICEL